MISSSQRDCWKRRPAHRLSPAPERRTHIAIADLLRYTCRAGWWWSHIPSGEYRTEATGALLKRMGLKRGMADFLLISPTGVHHWMELKRGNSPLTEDQEAFAAALRRCGVPYYVARHYEGALHQLKQWGVL